MTLAPGTKLGPYEIVSPLGAGGMGEVYRARDTRLGREVAVKVLPAHLASDPLFKQRFEREARTVSSLNNPHICTLYDIGREGETDFLVMEYLEGETLADRLKRGKLPLSELAKIGMQISDALDKAHRKGVVHRDLKPGNIMLTKGGSKLMDFGLAKPTGPGGAAGSASAPLLSAAMTADGVSPGSPLTSAGTLVGTIQYMSPEQIEGKEADARSDIFAFGSTLYEMATGEQAFPGKSQISVASAILEKEPEPISAKQPLVPAALDRVVAQCLAKDPDERFQNAHDVGLELKWVGAAVSEGRTAGEEPPGHRPALRRVLPWAVAALTAFLGVTAIWLLMSRQRPVERMQFAIPLASDVESLALSADGQMLAYVARDDASGLNMIYFQRLGSPKATLLAGTQGASFPFWSPDDSNIGFFADGTLRKISTADGAPQVLAVALHGRGGSWGSRGVIIYAPDWGGPLWRVNSDGSGAAALTGNIYLPGEASHRWPVFLPDGEHFLFYSGAFGSGPPSVKDGIYYSSLASKEKQLLEPAESNAEYANGHLYYLDAGGALTGVPLDPRDGKVSVEPVVISDRVTFQPSVYYGAFAAGGDDTLVYSTGSGAVLSALTWYDRSGKDLGRVGKPEVMANPAISPDGHHCLVDIADLKNSNVDIWIDDLGNNAASRFTFAPSLETSGVWSRDGREIAYRSDSVAGSETVVIRKANGLEAAKVAYSGPPTEEVLPNSWTPGDKSILCTYMSAGGGSDLELLDVTSGKLTPFLATKASETNGMVSPDGKWLAYASNESGQWEIYVTSFPEGQGKWQVSTDGGREPRWEGDGKEIFYLDTKGMLEAVPVNTGGTFSAQAPSPLFQVHGRAPIASSDLYSYDVSKDGKRFLVNRYVKPDHVEPLTVVLNAIAEVGK